MKSDPLTNTWDTLDMDPLQRLSVRRWVSMSLERAWSLPPTVHPSFMQSASTFSADFQEELTMGPENFKLALEYIYGPEEESFETQSKQCSTVFQAKMPGAMSIEEVQDRVNLDQWRVRLGKRLVHLQVKETILCCRKEILSVVE